MSQSTNLTVIDVANSFAKSVVDQFAKLWSMLSDENILLEEVDKLWSGVLKRQVQQEVTEVKTVQNCCIL